MELTRENRPYVLIEAHMAKAFDIEGKEVSIAFQPLISPLRSPNVLLSTLLEIKWVIVNHHIRLEGKKPMQLINLRHVMTR